MLEFYTNPMSRGQIVRWMLEEVGEPYEEHIVEYGPEMKSAPYIDINPMGKVPALRHDGNVVTEVAAICAYLADAFPAAGLGPQAEERADYYRWLFFTAGPFEQAITQKMMGWALPEEKEMSVGYGNHDHVMQTVDDKLSASAFIVGDRFTAADVYVGSQIDFGLQFGTLEKRATFVAYAERLRERAAYQKAKARDGQLIAEREAAKNG